MVVEITQPLTENGAHLSPIFSEWLSPAASSVSSGITVCPLLFRLFRLDVIRTSAPQSRPSSSASFSSEMFFYVYCRCRLLLAELCLSRISLSYACIREGFIRLRQNAHQCNSRHRCLYRFIFVYPSRTENGTHPSPIFFSPFTFR